MLLEQNDEYQLQCRYMQLEGMSALATPQIGGNAATDYAKSRLIDAARDHTRNYTTLTDVTELDNEQLIEAFARRTDAATAAMLGSASDADFADLPTVNLTLLATIFGTVHNVFERDLSGSEISTVLRQLALMCVAYLKAVKMPLPNAIPHRSRSK